MYQHFNHVIKNNTVPSLFITVIAGVTVFILSQFVLKLFIEPLVNFKHTIAEIDNKLKFYSNVIVNPPFVTQDLPKVYIEAKDLFRNLSCNLEANYKIVPFRYILSLMNFIPKINDISSAASDLIHISNLTGNKDESRTVNVPLLASEKIDKIRKYLKIESI